MNARHIAGLGVAASLTVVGVAVARPDTAYLVPVENGVVAKKIIGAGESAGNGYRMVGIPDGLGAYDNGDGTFTLLANHELTASQGIERAHGAAGAFVSKWRIDKDTLEVLSGEDLIQRFEPAISPSALSRLCSADLATRTGLYDPGSGTGFDGRLFTNGEESDPGRAFAHGLDGTSYELPRLGRLEHENVLVRPARSPKTVVVTTDDVAGGKIYVYVGDKQATGNPAERAGLTDGSLFALKVGDAASEPAEGFPQPANASLVPVTGDISTIDNTRAAATSAGATGFKRPEDAAWDPTDPNRLYFVTTDAFNGTSRLWRVQFTDATDPSKGAVVTMLLDGTEGQHMLDNLTVDRRGRLVIQEDPGANDYVAKVYRYSPATDRLTTILQHDPSRFGVGGSRFLTNDEESSGVIDAGSILGDGWFLADVQAHKALSDPELVQDGQLLAFHVPGGRR